MKRFTMMGKRFFALMLIVVMCVSFSFGESKPVKAASKYWIKVNKQANVATIYQLKDGKYRPIRACLTSCGGANTPSGTYYTPAKYRWKTLMGPSYGQYSTRIQGGVLFHSVWYYSHSKASQATKEFNRLGTTASHGCVRLSVADAKWIYDHCPLGTKVTIYSSSNPGPLGKPKGIKVSTARKMYWDPTDPDKNNPYNKTKPMIQISSKKKHYAEYKGKYSLKSLVTAKQYNGKSLTKNIRYSVKLYNTKTKTYVKKKFSTKRLGRYKITYRVKSVGGTQVTKLFIVTVRDTKNPIVTASNRTLVLGKTAPSNAVVGMRAKVPSGASLTKKVTVMIKKPGAKKYKNYTYAKAKKYKFTKAGRYAIIYRVRSTYKPYRRRSKLVHITVKYANPTLTVDASKMTLAVNMTESDAKAAILQGVTAREYNDAVMDKNKISVDMSKVTLTTAGSYQVTLSVTGLSKTKITKTVTVNVQ